MPINFRGLSGPSVLTSLTVNGPLRVTAGEPQYDIRGFGPASTAAERRTTAQAAIDAWGATGGNLHFHGAWDISGGSLVLPPLPLGSHTLFRITGSNDAMVSTTSAHPVITDTVPADLTALVNRANRRFVIENLHLRGSADTAQTLLRIIGSYGTEIANCVFESGGDGLDLIFALQPVINNCKGVVNIGRSLRLRSATGIVTGATGSSSGTNAAHVNDWRDYCSTGQPASIHLFEADGAIIDNLITEGLNPVVGVIMDPNNNTTVKSLEIRGWHNENTPSSAGLIVQNMPGGVVKISRPFWQTVQTLIDASNVNNTAATLIHIEDLPFAPGVPIFKGTVSTPGFLFTGGALGLNLRNPALWVGGVVPAGVCQVTYDGSGGVFVNGGIVTVNSDGAGAATPFTLGHAQGYVDLQRAAMGAPNGNPINPTLVANSRWYAYLDEATSKLKFFIKDSGGTVRSGEIVYT